MADAHPPSFRTDAFDCPYCGVFAHQVWYQGAKSAQGRFEVLQELWICQCWRCNRHSVWDAHESMVYPLVSSAPPPNADLPEDVRFDYEEAGSVLTFSPRASAALLRLAIQKLCASLGKGGNLNEAIGSLVNEGLPVRIQQALDVVRVIGNNAVHPGVIDLRDDRATAGALFGLVNLIADSTISEPNRIAVLYEGLPEGAKQQIARRDTPESGA